MPQTARQLPRADRPPARKRASAARSRRGRRRWSCPEGTRGDRTGSTLRAVTSGYVLWAARRPAMSSPLFHPTADFDAWSLPFPARPGACLGRLRARPGARADLPRSCGAARGARCGPDGPPDPARARVAAHRGRLRHAGDSAPRHPAPRNGRRGPGRPRRLAVHSGAGDRLPVGRGDGGVVESGARRARRRRHRRRGAEQGERRAGAAWAGGQHPALAAGRAQRRVLLRGPVSVGAPRGRLHPCDAGDRDGGGDQALRGQQRGGRPRLRRRPRLGAGAARDLPAGVRGRRPRGRRVERDVGLQPRQRSARLGERVPTHRRAQTRLGLRRARDVGLGRRP